MTRRQAMFAPFFALAGAGAQQPRGMTSRGVKAVPRGTPSGLPFHAKFVNVAAAAGLRAPVIYGGIAHADYLLESMGCGAAFLDYDNDGWLDIVLLTGRRFSTTPDDAVIRLYRNNRDGTFRDVTANSGLGRSVWAAGITVGDYTPEYRRGPRLGEDGNSLLVELGYSETAIAALADRGAFGAAHVALDGVAAPD